MLEERAVSLEMKRRGLIEDLFRRYNRQDLVSNEIKGTRNGSEQEREEDRRIKTVLAFLSLSK